MLNGKEIKLGVKYVDHQGKVVELEECWLYDGYPWYSGDGTWYTIDGKYCMDSGPSVYDLIGEYEDTNEVPIESPEYDAVTNPKHYQLFPEFNIEVKDVVALLCNRLGANGYNGAFIADFAQMLQYLMRFDEKNGKEDLEKAKEFLGGMIENYPDVQQLKGQK